MAVLLIAALPVALYSQIYYSCDFEDVTENSQWVLNTGARGPLCESKWFIGEAGNYTLGGENGLFVSSDSVNAVYKSTQAMYVVAYRELTLPVGTYNLDFDWRGMGNGSSAQIVVAWVPATQATNSNNAGSLAAWANNYKVGNSLYASKIWQPGRATINVTAATQQGKLVFVWSSARDVAKPPSGCVDNITITASMNCGAVANLTYNTASAMLSWSGSADYYQVRDYTPYDSSLVVYDSVATTSHRVQLNSEGTHYFHVRGVCNNGTSFTPWVSTTTFIWIPGRRCIEYMDLGISTGNAGRCYTGDFNTFIKQEFFGHPQQGTLEKVDLGPSSAESMHTLHTDLNEIDPTTTIDGGLSTVPDGEIASVRLGAYTGSGKSARIEYKYTVQAGMSDLLDLKYAVVMQSGGHSAELDQNGEGDMNPTFTLNILDGSGKKIDGCTQKYFVAGFGDHNAWHQEGDWFWCNWSTVTVSLRKYVGQTLTIRLTSARCSYDTHPAYAYFTMGCRGGSLEGLACGDFATDHFTAPEGFTYRWYKEDNPSVTLDTARTFHIGPLDADIYMVECHDLTDPTCYYTLTANPNPRFPLAQVTYNVTSADCQNIVDFSNSSYVRVVNRSSGETMSEEEPIYDIFYHYGDGEEEWVSGSSNRHVYPVEGGTFECYAVASMNDGVCQDTIRYTITLPDLLHTGSQDTVHICEGDSVQILSGEWVKRDTVYTTYAANKYGCDAPYDHYVMAHPVSYDSTVVEMCEGGYVDFEGKRYTETGNYTVNLRTIHGCDSVLELKLTVIPRLEVTMADTIEVCADDSVIPVPYTILKGRVSEVHVLPDSLGLARGFQPDYPFEAEDYIMVPVPEHLHPGFYRMTITLGTPDCPSDPKSIVVKVKYSSAIIAQKNDIVALLNENYNGGYLFYGYQWFRNDLPMPGDTTSYVVVTDADQGAKYYCMLISDDGTVIETCPIWYTSARTDLENVSVLSVTPQVAQPGETVMLNAGGLIKVYDSLGRQVAEYKKTAAGNTVISAPNHAGLYLIVAGGKVARIIVR